MSNHKTDKETKMNKTLFIWGIACLVLAGLLVVLRFVLPPEYVTFMIGGQSLLWIPLVILCVMGCILLVNAGMRAAAEAKPQEISTNAEKAALNKRLEGAAWGLFLIMVGGFIIVPKSQIPQGLWSIGIGIIMLGLNAARYFYGIRLSGFTTFLGILSLLGGLAELIGLTSLQGALLLIILGASLVLKPWFDKRQLFGKAEQS
jgi:hypothetical protein